MKKDFLNLAEMFANAAKEYHNLPAFAYRDTGKSFYKVSYGELWQKANQLAATLLQLGVSHQDKVGIFADNRLEWIIADMAIVSCGAVDVPRGSDVTDQDINYIIPHADIKVLFVENQAVLKKIEKNRAQLPALKTIILMDKKESVSKEYLSFYDLLEKGKKLLQQQPTRLQEARQKIQQKDLFTLIYTSGTTGAPKGVMLSHKNMLSQIRSLPIDLSSQDSILSILPVWHIFERTFEMVAIACGSCTYYTNVRNLREDLQLVQPTFMASAPRLWESIYSGIKNKIESGPAINRALFGLAYFFSSHFNTARRILQGNQLSLQDENLLSRFLQVLGSLVVVTAFFLPHKLFDALVFSKIRKATGGRLQGTCSGGGALPMHIDEFFNNIGIPVLEGYGLTETSPVISVRTFAKLVPGTVGPLYPKTELKIVDLQTGEQMYPGENGLGKKGEVWVKGEQVMQGYYKNPEATAKVLQNSWFKTGDIGMMTFNHCLKIIGRAKETIVLLGGENVEPVPIENKILESDLIEQCMVVGQDKKYLSALVVPEDTIAKKIQGVTLKKTLLQEVKKQISTASGFKSFEKVVDIIVLPKKFEVGDELTAKLSLKRHVITEKYAEQIESLY